MAQQDAFPRTAAAKHHHRLALCDFKVDSFEHILLAERLNKPCTAMYGFDFCRSIQTFITMNSLVMKKSATSTLIAAVTTALVVARPTPSPTPLDRLSMQWSRISSRTGCFDEACEDIAK